MSRVVVSVVHYGDPEPTLACLRSLRALDLPVLVVANGPAGSGDPLRGNPGVEVLEPGSNLGYGGGHNLAFRRALELGADYVLVLNNDIEVLEAGFVDRLVAAVESRPGAGIAGPLVAGPDGQPQPTEERFPSFPRAVRLVLRRKRARATASADRVVDAVNGVAMLVSRAAIDATGGFDEQYFMYGEEVDLCYRARRAGFSTLLCETPSIVHSHAAGEVRGDAGLRIRQNFVRFCLHHRGAFSASATGALFLAGAFLRGGGRPRIRRAGALARAFRGLAPPSASESWPGFAVHAVDVAVIPALIVIWTVVLAFGSSFDLSFRHVGSAGKFVVPAALVAVEVPVALRLGRNYLAALRLGVVHVAAIAFLGAAFLSAFWSPGWHVTVEHAFGLALLAGALLLGPWRASGTRVGYRRLAGAVGVGLVVVVFWNALGAAVLGHQASLDLPGGGTRFRGFLENPDEIGAYVLAVPVLLGQMLVARGRAIQVAGIATIGLLVVQVAASGTRTALALLVVVPVLLVVGHRFGRAATLALDAAVVVGIVCLLVLGGSMIARLPVPSTLRPTSLSTFGGRTLAWSASEHLIARRPLSGYGFGFEDQLINQYRAEGEQILSVCNLTQWQPPQPNCNRLVPAARQLSGFGGTFSHNSYLGLGVQLGVPAMAATVVMMLAGLARAAAGVRRRDWIQSGLVAGLVAGAVWGVFETYLWNAGNAVSSTFWLLFILGLAGARLAPRPPGDDRRATPQSVMNWGRGLVVPRRGASR